LTLGGRGLCQRGGGGGEKTTQSVDGSIKTSFLACSCHIAIKIMLKTKRAKKKLDQFERFGHKKIIGPRPLGGGRRVRPPWIR